MYFAMIIFMQSCQVKPVFSQHKDFPKPDIEIKVKFAALDKLYRLYVVTTTNQVIHFDENNKEIFRFANKRIGNITDINVSNPIKIVIYNKDFGRILELDNTLAEIQEFSLSDFGFTDVSAIGVSNDDGFWIYDPLRFRLIKIYANGKRAFESANVSDFGLQALQISKIIENGNKVVLLDEGKRFLIFDNFGQYLSSYIADNARSFQFDGNNIYYFDGKDVKYISLSTFENQILFSFDEEDTGLKDVLVSPGKTLKIYENGIQKQIIDR
ncbi:MAG: hypothetical protein IPN79_09400 [Saprospiraceae bacterium]|nr:hypothetical protein [Saprospiraceae bacterium]